MTVNIIRLHESGRFLRFRRQYIPINRNRSLSVSEPSPASKTPPGNPTRALARTFATSDPIDTADQVCDSRNSRAPRLRRSRSGTRARSTNLCTITQDRGPRTHGTASPIESASEFHPTCSSAADRGRSFCRHRLRSSVHEPTAMTPTAVTIPNHAIFAKPPALQRISSYPSREESVQNSIAAECI